MLRKHIPLIMEVIENIVSPDSRKKEYSDLQILKILVLLQIFSISYRSFRIFLAIHQEYVSLMGVKKIPNFRTLSRRAGMFDLHAINREITFFFSLREIAAMDSFMIHTYKYSTHGLGHLLGID